MFPDSVNNWGLIFMRSVFSHMSAVALRAIKFHLLFIVISLLLSHFFCYSHLRTKGVHVRDRQWVKVWKYTSTLQQSIFTCCQDQITVTGFQDSGWFLLWQHRDYHHQKYQTSACFCHMHFAANWGSAGKYGTFSPPSII